SLLFALILTLPASLLAEVTAQVHGVCKDTQGKPIAGGVVVWVKNDTGNKYEIKTNDKGEYSSLGIAIGTYTVTLYQGGKELYHFTNVPVQTTEMTVDFDLKKEMQAQGKTQAPSPQQAQPQEDAQAKVAKENANVKALNEKLTLARND